VKCVAYLAMAREIKCGDTSVTGSVRRSGNDERLTGKGAVTGITKDEKITGSLCYSQLF